MDVWWVGTVSTVIGALSGALLQAWRERVSYRRQLSTRWDETLLAGLADYLAAADRVARTLLRWRQSRTDPANSARDSLAAAVAEAFDTLHEKSQLVTLLSGDREHPVRVASRRMRETLRPLCEMAQGRLALDERQLRDLEVAHRRSRDALIVAAQGDFKLTR